LLKALRIPTLMSSLPAWMALTGLILAAPLLLPAGAPLVLTEFLLGVVFALYYGSLTRRLKHVAWPSGRNETAIGINGEFETRT